MNDLKARLMNALMGFAKGCLLPLMLLVVISYAGCSAFISYDWAGAIPKKIRVGRAIATDTPLVAGGGGSCGGAIFKLRKTSQKKILSQGLEFFSDKTRSRRWEEKTVSWTLGGSDNRVNVSFSCVVKRSKHKAVLLKKMRDSIRAGEAYYGVLGGGSKTRVLVLPKERLVFVGYWD